MTPILIPSFNLPMTCAAASPALLTTLRDAADSPAVQRLGWTLLHSLWQGAAVALLLALALAALRRRGAPARYAASCAALACMAILPALTFLRATEPDRTRRASVAAGAPAAPVVSATVVSGNVGPTAEAPATRPVGATGSSAAVVRIDPVRTAAPAPPPQQRPVGFAAAVAARGRQLTEVVRPAVPWLAAAWAAGVAALSVWNLGGWVAVQRLKSMTTRPADPLLAGRAARLATRLGLRRPVRLMESALAATPLVIGTLRPLILLPASIVSGLPAAQLESILLHELAHVRRLDYLVNLLQTAVETLMFYHPAAWWVSRRIRAEREHCCDDVVVAVTRDRATYARALAAVADAAQIGAGAPALAPAATGGRVLARVRRLLGNTLAPDAHVPRRTGAAVALCLGIVAAVGIIGAGAADEVAPARSTKGAGPATPQAAGKRAIDFMLVDKTSGGPIKTALRIRADSERWQAETDAEGRCRIEYPARAKYLQIFADHPAYVPTRAQFYNELGNEPPPESYALRVERGTLIGGTVVDEAGKPVDGATVHMDIFPAEGFVPKSREEIYLFGVTAGTDARGHWLFTRAPKDFGLNLRLIHPEFISDVSPRFEATPPVPKLHDTTAVMVMKKGIALAGRVMDAQTGKPVAGAEVAQGRDRWGNDYPVARTGDDGRFRFGGCRAGAMVLTVVAAGYAPDLRDVNVAEDAGDVEFKLAAGRVLRGRVVDKDGKPVAGARVGADTWRQRRSLMWRTETDLDGRFVWNEAPDDEVLGYVSAAGFAMVRNLPLVAGGPDKEQVFTLARSLKVSGVVTDAETGKPIDQFTVIRGTFYRDEPVRWDREQTQAVGRDGKFEYEVTEAPQSHAVRVEADGYAPIESRPFTPTAKDDSISLAFALKKSRGLTGVVRAPDGTPAVGAQLALAAPGRKLYVRNGRLPASSLDEAASTTADDFGRYRFPEQTGPFILVAVHDAGYAEVSGEALDKSGAVKLTAWATVRGTARVGSKPAAGQEIELDPDPEKESNDPKKPAVTFRSLATADDAGQFAFDRVPAGLTYVARTVAVGEGMFTSSHRLALNLTAGQQAAVQVGGTGRPVVGRVTLAPEVKARPWAIESKSIDTKVDEPPEPRKPAGFEAMSEAQQRAWWAKTGEAHAAEKRRRRQGYQHFPLLLDRADGTFRVDDVPPGRYELRVSVAAAGTPKYEHVGGLTREFTVPPVPGGQSDEPVDLGTLTVEPAGTK